MFDKSLKALVVCKLEVAEQLLTSELFLLRNKHLNAWCNLSLEECISNSYLPWRTQVGNGCGSQFPFLWQTKSLAPFKTKPLSHLNQTFWPTLNNLWFFPRLTTSPFRGSAGRLHCWTKNNEFSDNQSRHFNLKLWHKINRNFEINN